MKKIIFFYGALLVAMLFVACEQNETLNLSETPFSSEKITFLSTDTITLQLQSSLGSNTVGSGATQAVLGKISDPVFGETQASFFTQYSPTSSITWMDNPEIDSVVLQLKLTVKDTLSRNYFGSADAPINIEVYQVNSSIADTTFSTSFDIENEYNMTLVGTKNIIPSIETGSLKDSIFTIHLDNSIGTSLMSVDTLTITNVTDLLKGLYVKSVNSENNAIYTFDILDYVSCLRIHSRNETDTVEYRLFTSTFDTRMNLYKNDYSQAIPEIQDAANGINGAENLFIQGGGGFDLKIDFPYLDHFANGEPVVVTKAKFILQEDTIGVLATDPLFSTYILKNNEEGQKEYLVEYNTAEAYLPVGYYNGEFEYNITQYIQDVINNQIENNGLWVIPGNGKIAPTRTVLKGANNSKAPLKLVLTYTKFD